MSIRNEICPNDAQIYTSIHLLVEPILINLSKDVLHKMEIRPTVMVGDRESCVLDIISTGEETERLITGNMRLRFRKAFGDRLLMHCECIFNKDQTINNCSGFSIKGELKDAMAKRTAWTIRYSVWDWTGWE